MSMSSVSQYAAPQQSLQSQAISAQSQLPAKNDNDADDGGAPVKASLPAGVGGLVDTTA